MILISLLFQLNAPTVINDLLPGERSLRNTSVNYIVLHYDDGKSYSGTRKFLLRKGNSYHYYVKRNGTVVKLVDTKYQAGHAGISYYKGYVRMNRYSIGISLQNDPPQKYTDAQYKSTAWLITQLQRKYKDSTSRVILGHSEIAVPRGRKKDPGSHFNWSRLRKLISAQTAHNKIVKK